MTGGILRLEVKEYSFNDLKTVVDLCPSAVVRNHAVPDDLRGKVWMLLHEPRDAEVLEVRLPQ